MQTLINEVIKWGYDKGIIEKGTTSAQADKTLEEANELAEAVQVEDWNEIKDGIGDTMVTLILQAEMQGLDVVECLNYALAQIQGRTGYIVNGKFEKMEG